MNCNEFNEMISLYIDNELNNIDRKEFELHLMKCEECRKSYEIMVNILKELKEEKETQLPKDYNENLRAKLIDVSNKRKKTRFNWKKYAAIAAGLIIITTSISVFDGIFNNTKDEMMEDCGVTEETNFGVRGFEDKVQESTDGNIEDPQFTFNEDIMLTTEADVQTQKNIKRDNNKAKIIKSARIYLDVEKYDETYNKVVSFIEDNRGYIEKSQTDYSVYSNVENEPSLKRGFLKIRIPPEKLTYVIKFLEEQGVVKSKNSSGENITSQYYDVENRVKNLQIQEKRLREILEKAEKVEDILRVENELRRIRTEIDSNIGTLKNWDNLVSMSTIEININEVKKLNKVIKKVDNNMWYNAKSGFITTINKIIKGFENLIIWFVTYIPILLILGGILAVFYLIAKKIRNKKIR